jgi:hypothetical protein
MQLDRTRPAPDIRLRTCAGEEFQLSDLRSKQPAVLIFTGDALTEDVQARLADFAAQRAAFAKWSTAVVVLALPSVSCESLADWPYPVLLDENGEAHRRYLPDSAFAIFVLDRYMAPLAVETPGDMPISASEAVEDIRLSELSCAI